MSETYPNDLLYSEDHEWVRRLGEGVFKSGAPGLRVRLGITSFAQDELGEVVFVELPEVGQTFEAGDELGTIESVKAVAEIYSPVAGEVVAVNTSLEDEPEKVNAGVYGDGWLIELVCETQDDLRELKDAEAYASFVSGD